MKQYLIRTLTVLSVLVSMPAALAGSNPANAPVNVGPRVEVVADSPNGVQNGYFQVLLSDDQRVVTGLSMVKNGEANPTVLTAAQILASSQASPLALVEAAPLGKLVMIYKDAALSASTGGKINILIQQRGNRVAAGYVEVLPHGGGWDLTANGRPFTRISFKVTVTGGVESFLFQ